MPSAPRCVTSFGGLLEANRDLRAVVVGGTGDRAFCSGADLAQRADDTGGISQGGGDTFRPAFDLLLREIVGFPAPVIAAVNGAALGAGMQLAVACDLRVVAPNATFGIPAGRLGVLLSAVNVERLVRAVGQPMARDILLTARVLDVDDAAALGLVQRRADDAVEGGRGLAAEIAALAPLSVRGLKTMLGRVDATSALSEIELAHARRTRVGGVPKRRSSGRARCVQRQAPAPLHRYLASDRARGASGLPGDRCERDKRATKGQRRIHYLVIEGR